MESSLHGSSPPPPSGGLRALGVASEAVTGLIGLFSLWAWWHREWKLTALGADTVPMAPSTSWLLVLLAGALALYSRWHERRAVRRLVSGVAVATLSVALAVIVQSLAGLGSPWEQWLAGGAATVGAIPIGRMSVFTAVVLLLSAVSLLALQPAVSKRVAVRLAGQIAALLGGGFAVVTVLAYASGAPLFYGGSVVPMAWLTAVAVVFLDGALLLAGRADLTARMVFFGDEGAAVAHKPPAQERSFVIAVTMAVLVVVLILGALALRVLQKAQRIRIANELAAIATLKVSQISTWREDFLGDARRQIRSPFLAHSIVALSANPQDAALRADLLTWMEQMNRTQNLSAVVLFDRDQKVMLAVPADADTQGPRLKALLDAVPTARDVLEGDFDRSTTGELHLDLVAPVFTGNQPAPVGAVLLCVNPHAFLYPLLEKWPLPSATGETVLLRRDDGEVVYLNTLRHLAGPALSIRRSAEEPRLLASRVTRGESGLIQGAIDYRGAPVLGLGRAVPGTPWYVVAQMSEEEAYAPLREEASMVVVTTVAILCAAVSGTALVWRHRRTRILQRALQAEKAREAVDRRLALVMQNANDSILIMDEAGRILEASERALATYGYTLAELRALPPGGLRPPGMDLELADQLNLFARPGGALFETTHLRKDGSTFPVEVSGSVFEDDGCTFKLGVYRDISQRRAHEQQIERLNRIYAALSRVNHAIVQARTREDLFAEVCRVLVQSGRFKMAWIGEPDATHRLVPRAQHGDESGYLADIQIYTDPRPEGRGPTGIAFREGRTYVCSDFLTDAATAPWREKAERAGFHASIALPVRIEQDVAFALTVYAGEKDYFGPSEVALLEEVAGDLAFGVNHLEKEAAFRDTTHRLVTLIEVSPLAIVVIDTKNIVELWNPAAERIFGWTAAEVIGRPLPTVPHETGVDLHALRQRMMRGEFIPSHDTRRLRKDGVMVDVNASFAAMRDERGTVVRTIGLFSDISARKQAEASLRASETRFRALYENSLDGFMLTVPDGRVVSVNPAACRMLKRTEEEILRCGRGDLVLADDRLARLLAERARTGQTRGELTMIRGDGSHLEVELASIVFATEEGPRTSMAIRDITQRKQTEAKLNEQLLELRRWYEATLGREDRIRELKREVNELCRRAGDAPRYASAEPHPAGASDPR